ncbi:MAG: hypothetical protein ABH828_04080 [archaeon]
MAKDEKKTFFKESTVGQIKQYSKIIEVSRNLVQNIINLKEDEGLIIKANIIPSRFKGSRHFMKHGADVKLHRYKSIDEAIDDDMLPASRRIEALNNIKDPYKSGISFKPFVGTDFRTRKISLVENVEGTKIYTHAHQPESNQFTANIDVKPYSDAARVRMDGAEVTTKIPSRRKNHKRHEVKLLSVPVEYGIFKWGIAYAISTVHHCESKFYNIRYTSEHSKESSKIFNFCAHDVAAYLSTIDYYIKRGKKVPLHMSQFAIPSEKTVDYYNKLLHNVLIQTSKDEKARKLTIAEKEILLWGLVLKEKAGSTFMAQGHAKVRNYNWRTVIS